MAVAVDSAVSAAFSAGDLAAEAAIISAVPWLGLPGLKQLLQWLLSYITQYFYAQVSFAVTKIIIDLQVSSEVSKTQVAIDNLNQAIDQGNTAAQDQATKDLSDALISLVHYDGSHSP